MTEPSTETYVFGYTHAYHYYEKWDDYNFLHADGNKAEDLVV